MTAFAIYALCASAVLCVKIFIFPGSSVPMIAVVIHGEGLSKRYRRGALQQTTLLP